MRLVAEILGGAAIAFVAYYIGFLDCWRRMVNAPPPRTPAAEEKLPDASSPR